MASHLVDRIDARLLVQHVATCTHAELITSPTRALSTEQSATLEALVERRAAGEPLAYLLGSAGFYGREFAVTPAVLIPRPETELLVELAVNHLQSLQRPSVADLGTGSGVVAVTMARLCPAARITAVDLSTAALAVARRNAQVHNVEVDFRAGDWYSPLADERFDLLVANPPYVFEGDPHLQRGGLPYEPQMALTDGVVGGDGLTCVRVIVGGAADHLVPGGWLLLEHGYEQASEVRGLLRQAGFSDVASWTDLSGIERVSGGCLR
ncbi:peptide chain release factor N(5)-glutamine methyltransferase [Accumulibacter sp.]|uniref:peptide chain release factor N(5)-glutamine methyltransferase n=1 Tax=Accumulibacter sp. TaxID=2053492 RepID=UPI00262F6C7B|nr:peptide chain release factor N(5)-glutamine methyltransferase [Accumulibacter sp.]